MDLVKMWVVCSFGACVNYGVRFYQPERRGYPMSDTAWVKNLRWSNTYGPDTFKLL